MAHILNEQNLHALHELSHANAHDIAASNTCGCFYCLSIFSASEVDEYAGDFDGGILALCPRCGIDAVLPSASVEAAGFTLSKDLLTQMKQFWFDA